MANTDLARKHLDRRLNHFEPPGEFVRPPRGWVRAIREAIGMTGEQLARRVGVSQSRIMAIEKAEAGGSITLSTLAKVAEALDCTLVYAIVPNTSLDAIVNERARNVAGEQLARIDHTMRLEDQGVDAEDLLLERNRLAAELVRGNLRRLWDNK